MGNEVKKDNSLIIFYRTVFGEKADFPSICAYMMIDESIHVKLQCNGKPVSLPMCSLTPTCVLGLLQQPGIW